MIHFRATADTDTGIVKETNQDSILLKHGSYSNGEVLMAIVCDGMGGLKKGELASATVVRAFSKWFDDRMSYELENPRLEKIADDWTHMLKDLNRMMLNYSEKNNISLGTTFTGFLCIDGRYMVVHIGDSRLYYIGKTIEQLTHDQTFVAREIERGAMTVEEARINRKRNVLLQCVGASKNIEPEVTYADVKKGTYMLCSDGLRHEITAAEFVETLSSSKLVDKSVMHSNSRYLIELAKQRNEKDNISMILIMAE